MFYVILIMLNLKFRIQVTLKNHASGEEKILFLNSEQEKDKTLYTDQVLKYVQMQKTSGLVLDKN